MPWSKNVVFPPEVEIWWTLKMLLESSAEYAVRVLGLVSFYCFENAERSAFDLQISMFLFVW